MNKTDSTERSADSGFLSRWSRRKAQVQQGLEPSAAGSATAVAAASSAGAVTAPISTSASSQTAHAAQTAQASQAGESPARGPIMQPKATGDEPGASASHQTIAVHQPPQPTLQDVEQLDAASDYRAFVARDVDPQVRNAAFKKLFHSDPHFNVMDGLDVYIDDYNTPNPLPVAVMKTLVQARALGLIDDELKEQDLPPPDPAPATAEAADATAPAQAAPEGEPVEAVPPEHDTEALAYEADSAATGAVDESDNPRADVVHLLHVEPVEAEDAGLSAPAIAEPPSAGPGNVVPFPRRPGSAGPA